jgi:hypothetical protein
LLLKIYVKTQTMRRDPVVLLLHDMGYSEKYYYLLLLLLLHYKHFFYVIDTCFNYICLVIIYSY